MSISIFSWLLLNASQSAPLEPTLQERIIERLREMPAIAWTVAIFLILLGLVAAIAELAGGLDEIIELLKKYFSKEKQLTEETLAHNRPCLYCNRSCYFRNI